MMWPVALFVLVMLVLMTGYPVAFTLAGVSLIMAALASLFGAFDLSLLLGVPSRIYGIMTNEILIAVPLFIFMGVVLQRSHVAEDLLLALDHLCGSLPGGLGISVLLVGTLLAASTGIVGATVVTLGLLALPGMLRRGYDPAISCGAICASGTLGQIVPPSIILVLLGDVMSAAFQQAQLNLGSFSPETVSVTDLFMGAFFPGLMLAGMYLVYVVIRAWRSPEKLPPVPPAGKHPWTVGEFVMMLLAPLLLVITVLGAILTGIATPTEAAALGATGSLILSLRHGRMKLQVVREIAQQTAYLTCMIFLVLLGASVFGLVFRGMGGEELIHSLLSDLPGGVVGAVLVVMLVMFLFGFVLDSIEITYVVVPLVAPILLMMDINPVWLGVMIAVNLQTSFLTPPFGFSLFYLRGVAPDSIATREIYRGVMPFIGLQILMLGMLALWPELATWLPKQLLN